MDQAKEPMTEAQIQAVVMRALGGRTDVRVFRNQVGFGFVGEPPNHRPVTMGLHPGSGDLIGWKSVTVTPDMVGTKLAVFLSVEVKRPGKGLRPNQETWMRVVREHGGIAVRADGVDNLDLR
jgi:hypothetical protein